MAHQIPQPHPQKPAEGQQLKKRIKRGKYEDREKKRREEKRRVKQKRRKRDRNK